MSETTVAPPVSRARRRQVRDRFGHVSYAIERRRIALASMMFPAAIFLPSGFVLPLAGSLTLLRVAMMGCALIAIDELRRKILRGGYSLILSDIFVPLTSIWMLTTLYILEGPGSLGGFGAVTAIEFLLAYIIGRTLFGTPAGYSIFVKALRWAVAGTCFLALCDTLSGFYVTNYVASMLSGRGTYEGLAVYRFGLIRSAGPREHPILLGLFFVFCIILFVHSRLSDAQKLFWCGVCVFGTALALSSAPFISLFLASSIYLYSRETKNYPWSMPLLVIILLYCVGCIYFLMDSPLETLIKIFTFDPQTGLYRMEIWRWVALNVAQSPVLGIGFADWMRGPEMSETIDSLWLIQTIRHGLPATVFLLASMATCGFRVPIAKRQIHPSPDIDMMRYGVGLALFIFFFIGFTVHLWGANWALLGAIIGIRAGMTEARYLTPAARGELQPAGRSSPGGAPRIAHA